MAGVEVSAARRRHLFSGVLADHLAVILRDRVHSFLQGIRRPFVGCGLAVARVGLCAGRGFGPMLPRRRAYQFFGVSEVSDSGS